MTCRRYYRRSGSALISTMLVIVVLTIIVVAFLQSMTVERQTARSYLNRLNAALAADAGIADATGRIEANTTTDTYSVIQTGFTSPVTASPPYLLIAKPSGNAGPGTVTYVPLVSGAVASIPGQTMGKMPAAAADLFDSSVSDVSQREPKLPSYLASYYTAPAETRWITLKDPDGKIVSRYSYWVEDLQGRLDLQVVGNQLGTGSSQKRGAALGSGDHEKQLGEIGLFTLFDKTKVTDDGSTNAKKILNDRAKLLTGNTVKQLVDKVDSSFITATDPLQYFYYGLGYEQEPEIIPPGFGFVNANKAKIALNDTINSPSAVTTITGAISDNIPNFATIRTQGRTPKAGTIGMDPTTYLKNLAASIVDYADADSQATTDGSTYRGMDSYPLVNQWVIQTGYSKTNTSVTYTTTYFLELWNMSDKTISGSIKLEFNNDYKMAAGGKTVDFTKGFTGTLNDVTVSLTPNSKKVYNMGTRTYKETTTSVPPTSASATTPAFGSANYKVYWKDDSSPSGDFLLIDRSGTNPGGVYLVAKSFSSGSNWNASIPGLTHRISTSVFVDGSTGDPRSSYYISAVQDQSAWDTRGVIGGDRTTRLGLTGNTYGETKPSYWADSGFDGGAGDFGTASQNSPPMGSAKLTRGNWALAHYGNYTNSRYRSITELGHIFDPTQWQQYAGQIAKAPLDAAVKTGLSDIYGKSPQGSVKDIRFGGGFTLRIGRPEFSEFDNTTFDVRTGDKYTESARATALLGIFSTEATRSTQGLVNINTAPRDVLRALGAGITMTNPTYGDTTPPPYVSYSDPATISGPKGGVEPPDAEKPEAEADQFADAIIANRPFYSQHEMAGRLKVDAKKSLTDSTKSYQLFWGNPNVWKTNAPTSWRDAAAEEYLRQIYDLVTVRSRNFRIHATGEVLDKKGVVISTTRKISDIYIQPVHNTDDPPKITSQRVKHLYDITY